MRNTIKHVSKHSDYHMCQIYPKTIFGIQKVAKMWNLSKFYAGYIYGKYGFRKKDKVFFKALIPPCMPKVGHT